MTPYVQWKLNYDWYNVVLCFGLQVIGMSEDKCNKEHSLSELLCLHIEKRKKHLAYFADIRRKIDENPRDRLHNTSFCKDWINESKAQLEALELLQRGVHPDDPEFD